MKREVFGVADNATDSHGNKLTYDGTTDCVEFFKAFDGYCDLHKYGGVVSRDNFAEPVCPENAFRRTRAGRDNHKDEQRINESTKMSSFSFIKVGT